MTEYIETTMQEVELIESERAALDRLIEVAVIADLLGEK